MLSDAVTAYALGCFTSAYYWVLWKTGRDIREQIRKVFGDKVFKTVVPRNVRLAEAPSHGMPGIVYDKNSRGARAYMDFGKELIKRLKKESRSDKA